MELKPLLHQVQQMTAEDVEQYFRAYHERVADIPDPWADRVISWLETYCQRSGKAIRPLLVAVGVAMSQEISLEEAWQQPTVRQLMLAVELNHKRILMADDVADQDELRHGGPAMHVFIADQLRSMPQYADLSEETVVHIARSYTEVAGIWLQEMVTDLLLGLDVSTEQRQQINLLFRHHTYDMTATGWYTLLDQNFVSLADAEEKTFLEGLRLVTGEYTFVSPLLLGASLGEKYEDFKPIFTVYGQNAGVLFQITDDLIGLFGDPQETGKPVGNDLREGKKTLLMQYAHQSLEGENREKLAGVLGKADITVQEVAWVQEQVKTTGAEEKTRHMAEEYLEKSLVALESLPEGEMRALLTNIVQFILYRTK